MDQDILININKVSFHQLASEILLLCPRELNEEFAEGFCFFINQFFAIAEDMTMYFQIDDGISIFPLQIFLEDPIDHLPDLYKNFDHTQKKYFLLGIDLAVEQACHAIFSASMNYEKINAA